MIDGETEEEVRGQMEKAYDEMQKIMSGETVPNHQPPEVRLVFKLFCSVVEDIVFWEKVLICPSGIALCC